MTYAEKLKHPKWQRKRLEMLEAADFRCEDCDADDRTLNVHHIIYIPKRNPWDYERRFLRVLCESCHEQTHEVFKSIQYLYAYLSWEDRVRLIEFVAELERKSPIAERISAA